jgi:anti-sigma factor RsiW
MSCNPWRDKLDAYADGELSSLEATELAGHLRQCSACSALALENVQLRRSVAMAGKRYTANAEFRAEVLQSVSKTSPKRQLWAWRLLFAPAALVVLVSLAVNFYVGREKSSRDRIYGELADLHVSTLASATQVDVISTDRHTVKPWFEGKLPFSFNLPELQGTEFTLVGGRVAYLGQTPGAQLIYRLRKHEISVFIFQDRGDSRIVASTPVHEFSFNLENWPKNGLRYFIVGDVGSEDIESLSKLFRDAG